MSAEVTEPNKKLVSRNAAVGLGVGLGVVCIAFAVILAMVFVNPTLFNIGGSETTNNDLQAQVNSLQQQVSTLQGQLSSAQAPNLVNVGLGGADLSQQPPYTQSLRVTGYVVNTGNSAAYNAKLHVVAYFAAGAKAIDTEVTIGNGIISGKTSVQIDVDVPYSGSYSIAASSALMTPEWSATP